MVTSAVHRETKAQGAGTCPKSHGYQRGLFLPLLGARDTEGLLRVPAVFLGGCVTWGKPLCLSEPLFNGDGAPVCGLRVEGV